MLISNPTRFNKMTAETDETGDLLIYARNKATIRRSLIVVYRSTGKLEAIYRIKRDLTRQQINWINGQIKQFDPAAEMLL